MQRNMGNIIELLFCETYIRADIKCLFCGSVGFGSAGFSAGFSTGLGSAVVCSFGCSVCFSGTVCLVVCRGGSAFGFSGAVVSAVFSLVLSEQQQRFDFQRVICFLLP